MVMSHRDYFATGTILSGINEVFQSNRNDFPKVTFTFDGI
jgi:hypothetical protein